MVNNQTPARVAEANDAINFLIDRGYEKIINAIAQPNGRLGSGRINLAGIARQLNTSPKLIRQQLDEMKALVWV
jgi:hypothetical protein